LDEETDESCGEDSESKLLRILIVFDQTEDDGGNERNHKTDGDSYHDRDS
jgi:hypothetical protein